MAGQFATNHYQDRAQAARAAKAYTQAQALLTAERIETILRTVTVAATSLQTFASSETDPRRLERFVRGLLDQNPTILGMAIAMESPDAESSARYWYRRTDGSIAYRDIAAADPRLFTAMEWYAAPHCFGPTDLDRTLFRRQPAPKPTWSLLVCRSSTAATGETPSV